jgi:hypothetical protein
MSSHPLCPYCGDAVDLDWAVEVRTTLKTPNYQVVVRSLWYHEDCAERAGHTVPSAWDVKEGQDYQ